jgi:hypothetical protein
MDKLQAYNQFWNSFGIPAFDENSVPDEIYDSTLKKMVPLKPPYITYAVASDGFNNGLFLTASIWYRETSWTGITRKEKEISEYIGRGGVNVSYDNGAFWITKGTPWAQRMSDPEDDLIRRILLQINVEFFD